MRTSALSRWRIVTGSESCRASRLEHQVVRRTDGGGLPPGQLCRRRERDGHRSLACRSQCGRRGGDQGGGVVDAGTPTIDLSSGNISRQLPVSLERLGLSSVDLCMTHAPDEHTPIRETLEALTALVEQGLVRSIGACNVSAEQLSNALDTSDRLGLPKPGVAEGSTRFSSSSAGRLFDPVGAQ
jgi:aryl-alcohol dehydrogenase-like predicted oxidoreductase